MQRVINEYSIFLSRASLTQLSCKSYSRGDVNRQNGLQWQCVSMTSVTQSVTQCRLPWWQDDAAAWSFCPSTTDTTLEMR